MKRIFSGILTAAILSMCLCTAVVSAENEASVTEVGAAAYAPFTQNVSTGALAAGSTSYAGGMGAGSSSMNVLLLANNAYSSITDYSKASVKFDLSDMTGREVTAAKLKLNVKFQANNTGTLHIYGLDVAQAYSDAAGFVGAYTNWSELSSKLAEVGTYNRIYGAATSGTNIEIDIKDYIANAVKKGRESADLIFDFRSSDSNSTARSAYIGLEAGYAPVIEITSEKKAVITDTANITAGAYAPFTQNAATGALTAGAESFAGSMGNGSTSMNVLLLKNNAYSSNTDYGKASVKFDLSELSGGNVLSANLKLNVKFQANEAGTLYVYGIDNAGAYSDAAGFVQTYTDWGSLSSKVSAIGTYSRIYGAATVGTNIEIDIKNYVSDAVKSKNKSLDLMFEYRSSDSNSTARSAYIGMGEGYAPSIEVVSEAKPVIIDTKSITSEIYAPFKQNVQTGVLTADSVGFAGAMGNGSISMDVLALSNNSYSSITDYGKASIKFDISGLNGKEVTSAKLKLNMKFQANEAGILHIYGIDNAGDYTDAADFAAIYSNWEDLSQKVSELSPYSRVYGAVTSGTNIELDIKEYVMTAVESGCASVDLMFDYRSADSSSTARSAYIGLGEGYEPTLEVTSSSSAPVFTSNGDEITNLIDAAGDVTVTLETGRGKEVQTTAVPILAIYDSVNNFKKCAAGEAVVLDGTEKTLTATIDISEITINAGYYVKLLVWSDLMNCMPLQNSVVLMATDN